MPGSARGFVPRGAFAGAGFGTWVRARGAFAGAGFGTWVRAGSSARGFVRGERLRVPGSTGSTPAREFTPLCAVRPRAIPAPTRTQPSGRRGRLQKPRETSRVRHPSPDRPGLHPAGSRAVRSGRRRRRTTRRRSRAARGSVRSRRRVASRVVARCEVQRRGRRRHHRCVHGADLVAEIVDVRFCCDDTAVTAARATVYGEAVENHSRSSRICRRCCRDLTPARSTGSSPRGWRPVRSPRACR